MSSDTAARPVIHTDDAATGAAAAAVAGGRRLRRPGPVARAARRTAVALGWTLVMASVLFGVLARTGQLGLFLVTSDSMTPKIAAGDLVVGWRVEAASVEPGRVATVASDFDRNVTHRVTSVTAAGGGAATLTLRGDALEHDDVELYDVAQVHQMVMSIPKAGIVMGDWVPKAVPYLIGLIGVLFAFGWARAPRTWA